MERFRRRLNDERRERGIRPLGAVPGLDRLARSHSLEMARRRRVGHYSDEYGIGSERRVKLAYPAVETLAENVARNRSLEALHEALMASPGHRRNRLQADFTHVGIGLARRGPYLIYVTEIFVAAPGERPLGSPLVVYSEREPGSLTREEAPRAHVIHEEITVRSPEAGDPGDPEGLTHRGIQEFRRGDYGAAETTFRAALELDPDYAYARYNLARALVRGGRAGEARKELERLLSERPADLDARFTYGVAALLEGDYPAAEAAFRRVVDRRPGDADAWYNLGLALEYQDRVTEAAVAYRRTLERNREHRSARLGLARLEGS